ncbi:hypothetical protein FACS1894185_1170 [Betaproteobacteria bacterium]|nr:hypothetical protein AGMMS49545_03840 [Betaproteobacteria bacterium]GHU10239.1 hypothetical protein FACS1894185_1170 [Betaproteobacteria bacterium]GHU41794.1 hypothetical protein AGMMS50289_05520 [Betaproteobacteria bacterium]
MRSKILLACLFAVAGSTLQTAHAEEGATLFLQNCAACHGADALGVEGLAPPLKNESLWRRLGDSASAYIAGIVTGGMSGQLNVGDQEYRDLVMPPQTHLPSEQLATIASYVLQKINGHPVSVSAEQIEAGKIEPPAHKALQALRQKAEDENRTTLAQARN